MNPLPKESEYFDKVAARRISQCQDSKNTIPAFGQRSSSATLGAQSLVGMMARKAGPHDKKTDREVEKRLWCKDN
jgi:hypothetical protein